MGAYTVIPLLFVASAVLIQMSSGFVVLYPPELAGYYNSPWLRSYPTNISQDQPLIMRLTGSFAASGPYEGTIMLGCIEDETGRYDFVYCRLNKHPKFTFIVSDPDLASIETIIRRGKNNFPGISGWISCTIASPVAGAIEYTFDGTDRSYIQIPVWDSSFREIKPIRDYIAGDAQNRTVIIEIGWDDPNAWAALYEAKVFIVFSVVIGGYAFAVTGLAIHKLIMFFRVSGLRATIPQIVLWIEMFANLERGIWAAIDPLYAQRIFSNVPQNILFTISWPVVAITSLLITLYWKELLSSKQTRVITFLSKMKIPFIVLVVIQFTIEIVAAVLRGLAIGPVTLFAALGSVLYVVSSLLTSIFFLHYGRTIMATLKNKDVERVMNKSSKFKAVKQLMISASFELIYCLLLIMLFTPVYFIPWPYFVFNMLFFLVMITVSLIKVLAFATPSLKPKSNVTPETPKTSSLTGAQAAPMVELSYD